MSSVVLVGDRLSDAKANASLEVKRAKIDLSASGDLVALAAGKSIRVVSLALTLAASNTVKFQSGGSTDLSGAMTLTQLVLPFNQGGWFQTAAGEKLNLVEGSPVQASGFLSYIEV